MTELKTLKDISKKHPFILDNKDKTILIKVSELRAEAIKWIKYISRFEKELHTNPLEDQTLIRWIKYFFNITDEELK